MTAATLLDSPGLRGRSTVVALAGDIDLATAGQARALIGAAMGAPGTTVVVDTTAVAFIDCAGLRGLLAAQARLLAGGRSMRIHPSAAVTRLLELTGTTSSFEAPTTHPGT